LSSISSTLLSSSSFHLSDIYTLKYSGSYCVDAVFEEDYDETYSCGLFVGFFRNKLWKKIYVLLGDNKKRETMLKRERDCYSFWYDLFVIFWNVLLIWINRIFFVSSNRVIIIYLVCWYLECWVLFEKKSEEITTIRHFSPLQK